MPESGSSAAEFSKPTRRRRAAPASRRASSQATPPPDPAAAPEEPIAAGLSYNEARTALDLILAQLQSGDLDVEAMAGLHRRAQAYAQRCEEILEQVEQEVLIWDPRHNADPAPYSP